MDTNHLFEEFQQTNRLIRRKIYDQRAQEVGENYSPAQNRLLRVVAQNPGITQKDLAQLLNIRPASLSELAKKMQEKELLTRRQNEQDRRVFNFYLTAAGEKTVNEFAQLRQNYGSGVFAVLSETDQAELLRILQQLQEHLAE